MSLYYSGQGVYLYLGDALETLKTFPDQSINCIVTSPPYYGLRDYGVPGQMGLEPTPAEYTKAMQILFCEARRVLVDDGTFWLNLGDSFNNTAANHNGTAATNTTITGGRHDRMGARRKTLPDSSLAPKNLLGIPWRVAFALQDDGWILRNAIVWNKPNAMPSSVQDRFSSRYEMLFMLSKKQKYWFDLDAVREDVKHPTKQGHTFGGNDLRGRIEATERTVGATYTPTGKGKNPGDVWSISTRPFPEAHFAVMTPDLAERAVLAGCKPGGVVLDPFSGSGTTGMVALKHGRQYVGIDLSQEYLDLSLRTRFASEKKP